ncbi:MAG: dihydroorotase, partial [Bacilli bacterium]
MNMLISNVKIMNEIGSTYDAQVRVENGNITAIGTDLVAKQGETQFDGEGQLLAPGFVDVHVHLREPGGEHKETIETGTKSAARGGYTTVCAMPNTRPTPDSKEQLDWLNNRIKETASVKVLPYAAITKRLAGKERTNLQELKDAGAFAFTDDGVGIQESAMMYETMKEASALNMAVVAHCEDNSLIYGGCVHDGEFAKKHGLNGIPNICESVQIARDVLLAEAANCHYHVCHVSTKESVRVIRDAKAAGIRVTAEVSPHHLLLDETMIPGLDTNWKMNPPLRGAVDREALIAGLLDGTIDFIATDHAPHAEEEKGWGMQKAPFGIVGLETAFSLLYTHFVKTEVFTLQQLINWLSTAPAHTFGLNVGRIEVGRPADFVLLSLEEKVT